ncbi:bola-like protein [Hypoxylon fragiforme]|uniref:bola-like protein n=1 Tax=Hypoxylon fragiforme TaxID=63214 RepID=UPI0020C71BAC|nr:bola-like protein [Hypoxylon fragiforme]KAI2612269.1 bola-like protein [Hypoxylon fragiforme]
MIRHNRCRLLATIARQSRSHPTFPRPITAFTSTRQESTMSRPIHKDSHKARVWTRYYSASDPNTAAPPRKAPSTKSPRPEKPDYLNDAETAIWEKLMAEFSPTELVVQDISGGCGSMYGIEISSEKFRGVNMLKQQRMVNAVLGDQMKTWHGVQLRTKIP